MLDDPKLGGRPNTKALGYVYGFIDCALRSKGQDTFDTSLSLPIVFYVLKSFFPEREEHYIQQLLDHLKDEKRYQG
jgi:hypothetical protein